MTVIEYDECFVPASSRSLEIYVAEIVVVCLIFCLLSFDVFPSGFRIRFFLGARTLSRLNNTSYSSSNGRVCDAVKPYKYIYLFCFGSVGSHLRDISIEYIVPIEIDAVSCRVVLDCVNMQFFTFIHPVMFMGLFD